MRFLGCHRTLPKRPFEPSLSRSTWICSPIWPAPGRSDDLAATIDYGGLCEAVRLASKAPHVALLENLAERVAQAAMTFARGASAGRDGRRAQASATGAAPLGHRGSADLPQGRDVGRRALSGAESRPPSGLYRPGLELGDRRAYLRGALACFADVVALSRVSMRRSRSAARLRPVPQHGGRSCPPPWRPKNCYLRHAWPSLPPGGPGLSGGGPRTSRRHPAGRRSHRQLARSGGAPPADVGARFRPRAAGRPGPRTGDGPLDGRLTWPALRRPVPFSRRASRDRHRQT